jgi:hypothetical protein
MTVARPNAFPGQIRPRTRGMSDNSGKKKAKKAAQDGVLSTLPATRPARVGRARTGSAKAANAKPTRAPNAKSKPRAAVAQSPVETAKPPPRTTPKPPPLEPPPRREGPPTGADLAVTAARAVGELAQIGATVGAQVLKRAARRIPGA